MHAHEDVIGITSGEGGTREAPNDFDFRCKRLKYSNRTVSYSN